LIIKEHLPGKRIRNGIEEEEEAQENDWIIYDNINSNDIPRRKNKSERSLKFGIVTRHLK